MGPVLRRTGLFYIEEFNTEQGTGNAEQGTRNKE